MGIQFSTESLTTDKKEFTQEISCKKQLQITLILDTKIVISALIKDSTIREILFLPTFNFIVPEFAIEEIYHHK
ncbi:hypothetical protein ES705_02629 [subsurface metagenome]